MLELSPEDYADIRNIQPFALTENKLRIYEVQFKGEDLMDNQTCWVKLSIRPRRKSSPEQRLFDGLLWIKQGRSLSDPERRENCAGEARFKENAIPRISRPRAG